MKSREKIFSFLAKLFERPNVQVVKTLPPEAVIVCTAVDDGDYKEINKYWKLDGNKSLPRQEVCAKCHRQVMLSNWVYAEYQKNKAKGKPNKIVCGKCVLKL
jgi:ribosomal protein S27AE